MEYAVHQGSRKSCNNQTKEEQFKKQHEVRKTYHDHLLGNYPDLNKKKY